MLRHFQARPWAFALIVFLELLFGSSHLDAAEEQKPFFLPKSPTAAAYVLGRLSNAELIAAPRSEFVYVALLQRTGLERKYRLEALQGLASLRNTSTLAELIRGVSELDRKGTNAEPVLRDLSGMLFQSNPADLASQRAEFQKLSTNAEFALVRQIGWAACVTGDGSIDLSWRTAESSPSHLADLISSVTMIRAAEIRSACYSRIQPMLRTDSAEVRHAAISAISSLPGHELESFTVLAAAIYSEADRDVAVASLQKIPRDAWPKEGLESLVTDLLAYLQSVPVEQRTGPEATRAFRLASDLASALPAERASEVNRTLRSLGVSSFVLRALKEQMLFDKSRIVIEPGKLVEIILMNEDAMPHNLVVLAPGKLQEIGEASEKMSPAADKEGRLYIPDSPAILHATRLIEPGQQARLAFVAPAATGDYPFVCTFPGHWRRMSGTLAVVDNVEAYLATHPENSAKMTSWKLDDLAPDLAKPSGDLNLSAGRELFTQLACRQCHRIGGEGSSYGPDLSEVFQRWKGDRLNVLQQILEPSKVIEERYRSVTFELKDGDELTGMVLNEDPDTVRIQTGPTENLIQTIRKSEVQRRKPQSSSVMPIGLLNTLSKQQILDLLAYLEAGGKIQAHDHTH